jgi:hypothetical protein
MSNELGFSIACHQAGVPLLRGCLASIRYFAPDIPIYVVLDGDFSLGKLEKAYDLEVVRKKDVKSKMLREQSFAYGLTKMVALWEAPYKYVVHVDVDAVFWGNILVNLPDAEWDFVYNEPHEDITDFIQRTQYFDPSVVFNHIEEFPWQGNPYFNGGIFGCRVGALDFDEYAKLLEVYKKYPQTLPLMDQTILNIMVFRGLHQGNLKVFQRHLQSVVPVIERLELESRFCFDQGGAPKLWKHPTLIHWAGAKPYKSNPQAFSAPMDFFRELGMRQSGWPLFIPAETAMKVDEFLCCEWPRRVLQVKRVLKKMIGRS